MNNSPFSKKILALLFLFISLIGIAQVNIAVNGSLSSSSSMASPSAPPVSTDNPLSNRVDSIVQSAALAFMKNPSKVGLSIGVIVGGRSYKYNYGETAPGSGKLPSSNSLYEIGSITKSFTALVLAHAVAERKIGWNDDIRKFLKGQYPNLQYDDGRPVKFIHLVNHISRLPRAFSKAVDSSFTESDFEQELHAIKLDTLLPYRYNYSNLGYQLLGHLLENAYGMPYEDLIKKYVTGPLRMPDTRVYASTVGLIRGYDGQQKEMPNLPPIFPAAGALRSNVDDLLHYMDAQLSEKDPVIRMTHRLAFSTGESSNALPWSMGRTRDWDFYLREDGGTKGFRTFLTMYPDDQIGIILLSNETDNDTGGQLYDATTRIFKGLSPPFGQFSLF